MTHDDTPPKRPLFHRLSGWLKTTDDAETNEKVIEPKSMLGSFSEHTNLIGKAPVTLTIDGRAHILAFRNEQIILDGINYSLSRYDVGLDMDDVTRDGSQLSMTMNGNGKRVAMKLDEHELREMLTMLLKQGTCERPNEGIIITRF